MSEQQPEDEPRAEDETTPAAEPEWKRRRRLDAAFGDVLPAGTRDDRDERPDDGNDAWLLSQVPPHH